MRVIISPAKKMRQDDSLPALSLPRLLPEAEELHALLRSKTRTELKRLWKCNDSILEENLARLERYEPGRAHTPAILAYDGIQYKYMAPGVFTEREYAWVEEHLRILSGLYGVLRPFDGVIPYRLEMQAKLAAGGSPDLYGFWGEKIAGLLFSETDCIVDLASKEYSLAVTRHRKPGIRVITCVFGEELDGKIVEKGTLCKMARGEMVRYLAEQNASDPEALRAFDRLGYRFAPEHSDGERYVFLKTD